MVRRAENPTSRVERCTVALTQAERPGAIRAGWNDAAWGRPRRPMPDALERWYACGYAGGMVFRRHTA